MDSRPAVKSPTVSGYEIRKNEIGKYRIIDLSTGNDCGINYRTLAGAVDGAKLFDANDKKLGVGIYEEKPSPEQFASAKKWASDIE